jgi:hypothetical protein
MGTKALGLCQPPAGRPPAPEPEGALPSCPPDVAAAVLSVLLSQEVKADQVVARAVGLGLLRQPPPQEPAWLTPLALSRLFLAGYGSPSHLEAGNPSRLRQHLLAGRIVFVLLDRQGLEAGTGPARLELFQVKEGPDGLGFAVSVPWASAPAYLASPEGLAGAWAPAGNFLIAAARGWGELPPEGSAFFGGTRDRDGTYHWDTAECATNREGRIVSF